MAQDQHMDVGLIVGGANPDKSIARCRAHGVRFAGISFAGLPGVDDRACTGTPVKSYLKSLVERFAENGIQVFCLSKLNAFGLDPDIVRNPRAHRREIDQMLETVEATSAAGIPTILHYVNPKEPVDPAEDDVLLGNIAEIFRELSKQAEACGVKLANHGIWMTVKEPLRTRALAAGLTYAEYRKFRPPEWPGPYLVRTAEHIARIIEVEAPSPNNGVCLCTGMYINGADVPAMIRRFAGKIFMVQVRDLKYGPWPHSEECMVGNGDLDFPQILALLQEAGYRGMVHPEHFGIPRVPGEDQEAEAVARVRSWLNTLYSGTPVPSARPASTSRSEPLG